MLDSASKMVALVPARSGSKRLPGKNTKLLAGKPLIRRTIETALTSNVFAKILVSTDSEEIAKVAQASGASVPWLRPEHLATDTATTADVVTHALSYLMEADPRLDAVMLLQPTSPFRRISSIQNAVTVFNQFKHFRSIVSVSPVKKSLSWYQWRDKDGRLSRVFEQEPSSPHMQKAYIFDGLIYLSSFQSFFSANGFLNQETYGLVTENVEEMIDIDDEYDWKLAESFAEILKLKANDR